MKQTIKSSVLVSRFYWVFYKTSVAVLNFSGTLRGELKSDHDISLTFVTFRSYVMQIHEMDILLFICLLVAGFWKILRKLLGIGAYETFPSIWKERVNQLQ